MVLCNNYQSFKIGFLGILKTLRHPPLLLLCRRLETNNIFDIRKITIGSKIVTRMFMIQLDTVECRSGFYYNVVLNGAQFGYSLLRHTKA